jgi:Flp pilus assembly protein TadG
MRSLLLSQAMQVIRRVTVHAAVPVLVRDQRGGVLVVMAVLLPVLLMCVGLGIDISRWSLVKQELQRTVDLAAYAGAADFAVSNDAQGAANTAANLAEMNGAAGGTSRPWNSSTKILSDGQVTIQVSKGIRDSQSTAFQVIVTQPNTISFARLMGLLPAITIAATGWAEAQTSMQPCLVALNNAGLGVSAIGNASATLSGCSARSNASIATVGNANISASGFYANGLITGSETGGPLHPNDGVIADPYASYSPVQTALGRLLPGYGPPFKNNPNEVSPPLSSGEWSSWDIKGQATLLRGIYYVNGPITVGAQGSLSGTGITIVTSGPLTLKGGASLTLSAATTADVANYAIPGLVFAGNSVIASSFRGNTSPSLTGVVYYPNGALDFGGTAQGVSSGCLQVIASSVALKGTSDLAAHCSDYGTLRFNSDATAAAALVQ